MPHTYASVAEFNDFLRDNGSTETVTAAMVARQLGVLEAASRRVDEFCERSDFGSGFGPRIGTNRYDGDGCGRLYLRDDLLTVTSITILDATASSTSSTPVADTDYYLRDHRGGYDAPPYREIVLHGEGSSAVSVFTHGIRTVSLAAKYGYQDDRLTLTPTVAEVVDATETEIDVSALTDLSAGITILVDSEQLYIRATTDAATDSLTVERAANGTTAATHSSGAAIARYRYPRDVVETTLLVAQRRWKMRDAGVTGQYGGGMIPMTSARDSEWSILHAGLADYCFRSAA